MLEFTKYDSVDGSGSKVHVCAAHVVGVEEDELRVSYGGWRLVAVIELVTGTKHVVVDDNRTAAKQINKATRKLYTVRDADRASRLLSE